MKRYNFNWDPIGECDCSMDENSQGEYVKFEDFKKEVEGIIQEIDKELNSLIIPHQIDLKIKLEIIKNSLQKLIGE